MKRIIYLGIAVFAVMLIWCGAWFYAGNEVKNAVLSLANADGESAPKLSCDSLDVAGFPFRFDVTCTGANLVSQDTTVAVAEVRASILVYDPWHALAFAKSPATLSDAFTGSRNRLDWSKLEASIHLTGWRIGRLSVDGDNLAFNDTAGGDNLIAKLSNFDLQGLDIPEQYDPKKGLAALALYIIAKDVNAPGLQINDGQSSFEADLGALPADVRDFADPAIVKRWQQAGGKVKLYAFKGSDGEPSFDVGGTLGLDDQARLEGQLKANSKGVVERLGTLVPDNVRPLVLGNPAKDGSYSQVINIRAGVVLSGIVPIAMIPPLL